MATATVELPRPTTPRFPQRCIFCGRSNPDATLKVRGHQIRWWTVGLGLLVALIHLWKPHVAQVPACTGCRTRFRRQQIVRPLVALLVLVPALTLVAVFGSERAVTVASVLLVAFLPRRALYAPPPVEAALFARSIEFEFTDAAYAQEFAGLNGASLESS